ncbi:DNA-binding CsgD family transcriptional regulator [Bacillus mesophilus]|nr:helix-turn-helix transcriptional regulator [Bacillus mesophilus]MBM7661952.1 DNA-binding CsgD family transcriptional regulator [Bacillus mesophilus]
MNNVREIIEAYSDYMKLPLFLISEDGIVDFEVNMESMSRQIVESSQIIDDLISVGRLIRNPTIITPTNEDYAGLTFILSPPFKHINKGSYILGGPFSEDLQELPIIDSVQLPLVNGEQKLSIFRKMRSLTTVINSLYDKENNHSEFVNVFNFLRDFKYELEKHEDFVNSLLKELTKTSMIDFMGVAAKNNDDVFVIKHAVGETSEKLIGQVFHIGEGILGQAVAIEKEMKLNNISDSPRFSFFHKHGIMPVHFFSVPVAENGIIEELYFGGTHDDHETNGELFDFIKFIVLFINEKQKNSRALKNSALEEKRFDGFLDLLTIYLQSQHSKNVVYKILDFCKLIHTEQTSCFTFKNGELISLVKPSEELLHQHSEFITHNHSYPRRNSIKNLTFAHYPFSFNDHSSGVLTIMLSNLEEKEVMGLLVPLDLLMGIKKAETITTPQTDTELLKDSKTNHIDPDLNTKRNIGLEEIQNMIDINSVISELPLTTREKEILHLILEGLNNQEVGSYLNISVHTVKNHITNIYKKLNVTDRVQAMTKIYRIKYGDE